jgi:hypothetical protein
VAAVGFTVDLSRGNMISCGLLFHLGGDDLIFESLFVQSSSSSLVKSDIEIVVGVRRHQDEVSLRCRLDLTTKECQWTAKPCPRQIDCTRRQME